MRSIRSIKVTLKADLLVLLSIYALCLTAGLMYALTGYTLESILDAFPQICVVRRLTGFLCPSCGLTHAFLAMGRLDWRRAIEFHVLSPLLFIAGLVALAARLRGWRWPLAPKATIALGLALLGLFLTYGILRNL